MWKKLQKSSFNSIQDQLYCIEVTFHMFFCSLSILSKINWWRDFLLFFQPDSAFNSIQDQPATMTILVIVTPLLSILSKINRAVCLAEKLLDPEALNSIQDQQRVKRAKTFNSIQDQPPELGRDTWSLPRFQFYPRSTWWKGNERENESRRTFNSIQDQLATFANARSLAVGAFNSIQDQLVFMLFSGGFWWTLLSILSKINFFGPSKTTKNISIPSNSIQDQHVLFAHSFVYDFFTSNSIQDQRIVEEARLIHVFLAFNSIQDQHRVLRNGCDQRKPRLSILSKINSIRRYLISLIRWLSILSKINVNTPFPWSQIGYILSILSKINSENRDVEIG